ncbi:hypothetical protein B0T10DRAFT_596811 [Thelonectria olida]|uniref:Uncharacterized protein n=1 Tax=Thelonectria olida TaxID=1576542 RepID=A0A9P8W885_9HYPO|nr:hypothetical protein B0T10DRAFT_596811 [Thelonectria olida]
MSEIPSTETPQSWPDNCGIYWTTVTPIDPDPDIAGIGVLISFIAIGSVIMILGFAQVWRNENEDFNLSNLFFPPGLLEYEALKKRQENGDADAPGECETKDHKGEQPPSALSWTLFALGDTQFAMGIAICAATLAKRDITAYHYLVANELIWLAMITSTLGFFTTRTQILDKASPFKVGIRVALMWTLFGLILGIEFRRNDFLYFAESVYKFAPAWDWSNWRVVLSFILLLFTSLGVVIDTVSVRLDWALWMNFSAGELVLSTLYPIAIIRSWECPRPRDQPTAVGICVASSQVLGYSILLALAFIICPVLWLASLVVYSFTFQPFTTYAGNLAFFLWGSHDVFLWRLKGKACMQADDRRTEDEFGFGQVIALTLLISPIINSADLWAAFTFAPCCIQGPVVCYGSKSASIVSGFQYHVRVCAFGHKELEYVWLRWNGSSSSKGTAIIACTKHQVHISAFLNKKFDGIQSASRSFSRQGTTELASWERYVHIHTCLDETFISTGVPPTRCSGQGSISVPNWYLYIRIGILLNKEFDSIQTVVKSCSKQGTPGVLNWERYIRFRPRTDEELNSSDVSSRSCFQQRAIDPIGPQFPNAIVG